MKDTVLHVDVPAYTRPEWHRKAGAEWHDKEVREVTYPAVTVEITLSGSDLYELARKAQRNKSRRAGSGPAMARAVRKAGPK